MTSSLMEYPNIQPSDDATDPSDSTALFDALSDSSTPLQLSSMSLAFRYLLGQRSSSPLPLSIAGPASAAEEPSSAVDSLQRALDILEARGGVFCVRNRRPAPSQLAAGANLKIN